MARDAVLQAAEALAALETKRADAAHRQEEIGAERAKIAYAALTGDAAALKQLELLTAEATARGIEIETLDAAIQEGKKRAATARQAAADEAARCRAEQARQKLAALQSRAAKIDEHMVSLVRELEALQEAAAEINRTGFGALSFYDIGVHLRYAFEAAFTRSAARRQLGMPMPETARRKNFSELVAGLGRQIEARISAAAPATNEAEAAE